MATTQQRMSGTACHVGSNPNLLALTRGESQNQQAFISCQFFLTRLGQAFERFNII